jgi:hypothetical protein
MDTLNSAIENLMTSSNQEDWPSVNMNVADATVTVISEKVRRIWRGHWHFWVAGRFCIRWSSMELGSQAKP